MHLFAYGVAMLAALAIIGIGVGYLVRPEMMAPSFGLPLPEGGPNTAWWLRLKGTRDVVSGILVLVFTAAGEDRDLGLVVLIAALIPLGDMATVLAAKGRTSTALSVHGLTATLMILADVSLLREAA